MKLTAIPEYQEYVDAYARGDLLAARDALLRTEASDALADATEHRAFVIRCLASVLFEMEDREGARGHLEQAESIAPESAPARFYSAAFLHSRFREPERALDKVNEAIAMMPPADEHWIARATALKGLCDVELRKFSEAHDALRRLIELREHAIMEHGVELCAALIQRPESEPDARHYLHILLGAIADEGNANLNDLKASIERILQRG